VRRPFGHDRVAVRIDASDAAFLSGGKKRFPVRTESQREDRTLVLANDADHAADLRLPDAHRSIVARRSAERGCLRESATGARSKRENMHGFGMVIEGAEQATVLRGPDFERAVGAGRNEAPSGRAERDGEHGCGVASECENFTKLRTILSDPPNVRQVVRAGDPKQRAVGIEGHAGHQVVVIGQAVKSFLLAPVQEQNFAAHTRNPTSDNQKHVALRRAMADAVQRAILDAPLVDWEARRE